ncbi:MAG: peptidylprolyl isomerase [bacterium]
MRSVHYIVMLGATCLAFLSCSSKHEIEKNSELYKLAKALTLKYSVLHPDSNKVLVRTKEFEITWGELLQSMSLTEGKMLHQLRFSSPQKLKALIQDRAEAYVLRKHLLERARKANLSVTEEEINRRYLDQFEGRSSEDEFLARLQQLDIKVENVKSELEKRLIAEKYVDTVLAPQTVVTPEEIEQVYEQGKTATFRHILMSLEDKSDSAQAEIRTKMEEILARARSGQDFAELARKYSQDQGSKKKGGLYVDMDRFQMDSDFARTVFALPLNEISDIIETPFGYHIVKVISRKKESKPLEEVRAEIEQWLRSPKWQKAYSDYLSELRKEVGLEYVAAD